MQPFFGLTVFVNENTVLPVILQDATGGALTGYLASSVTLQKSLNGAALSTLTASGWSELGHGLYAITVAAAQVATEGTLVYRVATNPAGTNPAFNGCAQVTHRLDQYACEISPQYDEVTQDFAAFVWLTHNGELVADPVSCQIWLKDTLGATAVNITSILPNAEGVFVLTQSEIALALSSNYECLIWITDADGVIHKSVLGAISFN